MKYWGVPVRYRQRWHDDMLASRPALPGLNRDLQHDGKLPQEHNPGDDDTGPEDAAGGAAAAGEEDGGDGDDDGHEHELVDDHAQDTVVVDDGGGQGVAFADEPGGHHAQGGDQVRQRDDEKRRHQLLLRGAGQVLCPEIALLLRHRMESIPMGQESNTRDLRVFKEDGRNRGQMEARGIH